MEENGENLDNDWRPPTEAEQKVLLARRERSDKISKRMSEYLLKGNLFKFFNTFCMKQFDAYIREFKSVSVR